MEKKTMTVADICRAWDRPNYVSGDVPSTHTVTLEFRKGDRTPEVVGHVLMKFQPYLQRYANRHFPKYPDEAEEAYVELVLAVVKTPEIFNKDFEKSLRSFIFRSFKNKLNDIIKHNHRWQERKRRAGEYLSDLCHARKSERQRAHERCLSLSNRLFISGLDADVSRRRGISEIHRAIWAAYFEDRLTRKAIAAKLNMTTKDVSNRIIAVKAYLRNRTQERLSE